MFRWVENKIEELKKLSSKKEERMKEEQIKAAKSYFYCQSGYASLVEAGYEFPLLSAAEIVNISIKESKRFNYELGNNQINNPGIVGQVTNRNNQGYKSNWPLHENQHSMSDLLKPSVHIKIQNGHILSLDDKKDLIKQLRKMESILLDEIRIEEEKNNVKVKKRKLI